MKIRKSLSFLVVILLATSAILAQDKVQKIDDLLKTYHEYNQFNGAILVAENGKVIYKKGHGLANKEWGIPNTPDTKFRIGSVTKQFTAAIIMQLVEEGKIKLDGKITDYLPDYRKDTGSKVTIHQLLNHTSGIPSYTNAKFFREDSRDYYSPADFVKKFSSGNLQFEPGKRFAYNNSGYFILGAIIEKLDGMTYAESLQKRILKPLGMTNTGYDTHSPILKKRARGYEKVAGGKFINTSYLDMSLPYAAGSMYSTVEDLYKWDQALYGNKVLSTESKKKMFTPGLQKYGYGFFIDELEIAKTDRNVKTIGHGGGINGFNALFTRFVDQKNLVVILDNITLGRYHTNITRSINNILNGEDPIKPKKSVAEALYKTAFEKGGKYAVSEYKKLKTEKSDDYDFSENELNTLGYQLLGEGKTQDAIEIFKLNVEMFPKASNPYDSLGEAYLKAENKELALKNYKKSVELNPNNANAVRVINEIEGKTVTVSNEVLDTYVGEYELTPGFVIAITREENKLMGQPSGQSKLELKPVSETKFVVPNIDVSITFEKDSSGKVNGFEFTQRGRTMKAKRIK